MVEPVMCFKENISGKSTREILFSYMEKKQRFVPLFSSKLSTNDVNVVVQCVVYADVDII
jgi:hypothetical protein